ncbi:roadblock/LC7 domain-containing protein [Oceanobacter mangrovi]|uniref:roadblock/LC7 domain-containing protein n=1 Tax=Oceanobacter mangrovi TaxID=2862510 RepID=UPI001C8ED570|nr:roadblock/LC7 domain-containing protein [Oceanobacter mangrovi]
MLAAIQEQLEQLANRSDDLLVCMVVSTDGLVIAHHGNVKDPDLFGAYFFELKVVCEKIITELDCDEITEIYIRSKTGAVTLLPIFDKGYLACLSSVKMNAGKVQILAWKHAQKIYQLL